MKIRIALGLTGGHREGLGSADGGRELPYADTGWVTLHGGRVNRKQQLGVDTATEYTLWTALQGAPVLTPGVAAQRKPACGG